MDMLHSFLILLLLNPFIYRNAQFSECEHLYIHIERVKALLRLFGNKYIYIFIRCCKSQILVFKRFIFLLVLGDILRKNQIKSIEMKKKKCEYDFWLFYKL